MAIVAWPSSRPSSATSTRPGAVDARRPACSIDLRSAAGVARHDRRRAGGDDQGRASADGRGRGPLARFSGEHAVIATLGYFGAVDRLLGLAAAASGRPRRRPDAAAPEPSTSTTPSAPRSTPSAPAASWPRSPDSPALVRGGHERLVTSTAAASVARRAASTSCQSPRRPWTIANTANPAATKAAADEGEGDEVVAGDRVDERDPTPRAISPHDHGVSNSGRRVLVRAAAGGRCRSSSCA